MGGRVVTVAGEASTGGNRARRRPRAHRWLVVSLAAAVSASVLAGTGAAAAEERGKPFSALDKRVPPPPSQATEAKPLPEPTPKPSDSPSDPLRRGRQPNESTEERELSERRTANSATFGQADGTFKTVVSSGPMHYRDRQGKWQNPDNTLVDERAPGYALVNKTNGYRAQLPADLGASPVRVAAGDDWVSFALEGAKGSPKATANRAEYKGALPGVDVSYSAQNGGLKEDLTLMGPGAPSRYAFSLTTSPALVPTLTEDGAVEFRRGGDVPLAFMPPTVVDANGVAGPVRAGLEPRAGGSTYTLAVDDGWLRDPGRAWPVVVDPNVAYTPVGECRISNANTSPNCSQAMYPVSDVSQSYPGTSRMLLQFKLNDIPFDARVTGARLDVHVAQATPALALHRITRDWAGGSAAPTPTFWQAKTSVPWTTPGGDIDTTTASYQTPGYVSAPTTGADWAKWWPTQLVQDWVSGQAGPTGGPANQGVLLKLQQEGALGRTYYVHGMQSAYAPSLTVSWSPRIGIEANFKFDSYRLTDRLNAGVNLANGNLVVRADDVRIAGTGLDLALGRIYNGRAFLPGYYQWRFDLVPYVSVLTDGGVGYFGPAGEHTTFHARPGGGFVSPPGVSADLTQSGNSFHLTDRKSGTKIVFGGTANTVQYALRYRSSIVDRNGNTITFNYPTSGGMTSITDTQGRIVTVSSPGTFEDRTTTLADQFGRTWRSHTASGLLDYSTDPENKTTYYSYDANRRLAQITTPEGRITRFNYHADDSVAKVSRVTDPVTGATSDTTYSYTTSMATSRCAQFAAPGAAPTDPVGMVGCTTVTDGRGNRTSHGWDHLNQVVKVVDGRNNVTSTSFSADRQVTDLSNAVSAAKTRFNYDASAPDKPTGASLPTGAASALGYKAGSPHPYSPDSATDAQGNCSAFGYTALGNLSTSSPGQARGCNGPGGTATVTNAYEGEGATCGAPGRRGLLCRSTDARGAVTSYLYDPKGNLTKVTPPAPLGAVSHTPDGLSRTMRVVDGKGQGTRVYYDRMDRVATITYGGDESCTNIAICIGFAYDGDGNLVGRSDVSGYTGFVYDRVGRLTEKWPTGAPNVCVGYNGTRFTYDAAGNLASYCDAGGTVTYTYDAANDVASVTEPGARTTTYTYTADHQRATATYPGGVRQTFGYDASARITSVATTGPRGPYPSFTYCYHLNRDCGANASPATDTALRRESFDQYNFYDMRYSYDSLNRLTVADRRPFYSVPGRVHGYSYDANGNRTQATVTGGPTTYYDYNAANQLCLKSTIGPNNCVARPDDGEVTYGYDANGSQLNTTPADRYSTFAYDVKGFTASIKVGAATTAFAYADIDQTERTKAGPAAFSNSPLGHSATVQGSRTNYTRTDTGGLVSQRSPAGTHYYLFDGLGSVVGLTDVSGNLTNTYRYDPYGNDAGTTGTVANPYRYASGHLDTQTGLYKFGARYYDPTVGRWTQQDPSGQDANPYAYVGGNPVNFTDPSGYYRTNWGNITGSIYFTVTETSDIAAALADMENGLGASITAGALCGVLGTAAAGFACGVVTALGYYALGDLFRDASEAGSCVQIVSDGTVDIEPLSNGYCDP